MGATLRLAEAIVKTNFKDMPPETVTRGNELMLDFISAALAGAQTVTGKVVTGYVKEMKARPDASVIGGGFKTTAENAALANGTLDHAPEFEAVAQKTAPNISTIIAPALALADKLGLPGSRLLEGFIIGFELQGRICNPLLTVASTRGGRVGGFMWLGAAAAAAKVLGLDVQQTRYALSAAADEASMLVLEAGTMQHFLAKPSADGVQIAELAQRGFTAHPDAIEAPQGFSDAYVGAGVEGIDFDAMTRDFGKPFLVSDPGISIKKYPCCYRSHRALDALFDIMNEHKFSYDDVKVVEVDFNLYDSFYMKYQEPKTGIEGRFSFPHVLGTALVDRKVWLESFTDEAVNSNKYRDAQKKVKATVHKDWPGGRVQARTPVTVRLNNGQSYTKEVATPREPTREELLNRYRMAAKPLLSAEQTERSIKMLLELDRLHNVQELMNIVSLTK